VADFDQPDVVLDRQRILEAEEHRGGPLARGAPHVVAAAAGDDQFRIEFEPAVPAREVGDRLAKILVVADGNLDRGHAAGFQLVKDLLRPIAVLGGVDDHRLRRPVACGHAVKPCRGS
jgi:hypothetical protein